MQVTKHMNKQPRRQQQKLSTYVGRRWGSQYAKLLNILFKMSSFHQKITRQVKKQESVTLYSFSRAAITKYQRLYGLNNRTFFSQHSVSQMSKIKVSFFQNLSPYLQIIISLHCLCMVFVCICPNLFLEGHQLQRIKAHSYDLILFTFLMTLSPNILRY